MRISLVVTMSESHGFALPESVTGISRASSVSSLDADDGVKNNKSLSFSPKVKLPFAANEERGV